MYIEFDENMPVYTQIIDGFKRQIFGGHMDAGSRIPPVRELSAQLGVNPNTLQKALAELERCGLVKARRTAGRFVTPDEQTIIQQRQAMMVDIMNRFLREMGELGCSMDEILDVLEHHFGLLPQRSYPEPQRESAYPPDVPYEAEGAYQPEAPYQPEAAYQPLPVYQDESAYAAEPVPDPETLYPSDTVPEAQAAYEGEALYQPEAQYSPQSEYIYAPSVFAQPNADLSEDDHYTGAGPYIPRQLNYVGTDYTNLVQSYATAEEAAYPEEAPEAEPLEPLVP